MTLHHALLIGPNSARASVAERIRMQGYQVTATVDVAAGAHLALSDPPAIVIADLWMPGISGIQLCRLLRSEPATEHVPVILRGPEQTGRDRFWAERAGAAAYVAESRMGDLARAIAAAIAAHPPVTDAFFTQLSGGELDLRDRIAHSLDAALFESVIASEVRALGACGSFDRMFDLLSQFVVQVSDYRWLAVTNEHADRFGLHTHPAHRALAEREARAALGIPDDAVCVAVEDEDALPTPEGPPVLGEPVLLGGTEVGHIALATRHPARAHDAELLRVIARELGGPIRIATLMEDSQRLALVDTLTGLFNRRAFISAVERELGRFERHGVPLCVLLLDVDHFKAINDQRGHAIGDAVLTELGKLLPRQVRKVDVVGRWGGEEFVLALTGSPTLGAVERAEAIRAAIEGMVVYDGHGDRVSVTASVGLSSCVAGDTVDTLVDRADRAMYLAKKSGRNRVMVKDAPPLASEPPSHASEAN